MTTRSSETHVLFLDAAGTLFDLARPLEELLLDALSPKLQATTRQVRAALDRADEVGTWPEDQKDADSRLRSWTKFAATALQDIHGAAASSELSEAAVAIAKKISTPTSYMLKPGAIELLHAVRQTGTRCAVISNFDHLLLDILDHLEILPLLEDVVFSGATGAYKPSARIFNEALRRMKTDPQSALMVGDSVYSDIDGAQAVGIRAVLYDPQNRFSTHHSARVTNLVDVVSHL